MLDLLFVEGHLLEWAATSPFECFGSVEATFSVCHSDSSNSGRGRLQQRGHLFRGGVLLQLLGLQAPVEHRADRCSSEKAYDLLHLGGHIFGSGGHSFSIE